MDQESMSVGEREVRVEDTEDGPILYVAGDLVLARAAAVRRTLVNALRPGKRTTLDLAAVESIDLSGLQLLSSAALTYARAGAQFVLRGAPQQVLATARAAGFCAPSSEAGPAAAIWACGGGPWPKP